MAVVSPRRAWIYLRAPLCIAALAACSSEFPLVDLAPAMEAAKASQASPVKLASTPAPTIAPMAPAAAPVRKASAEGYMVMSVLQPDAPIQAGDYVWDAEGVGDGPLLIAVDLGAQRIYVYRGGVEIGRSSILYGADDKPTPTGTFKILQKKKHHISNLYGAPMPFMLRLTNDGIAIHGSEVEDGSATHGCIGLPDDFAELLFAEAGLGDRVVIAQEWMRELYYGARTSDVTA